MIKNRLNIILVILCLGALIALFNINFFLHQNNLESQEKAYSTLVDSVLAINLYNQDSQTYVGLNQIILNQYESSINRKPLDLNSNDFKEDQIYLTNGKPGDFFEHQDQIIACSKTKTEKLYCVLITNTLNKWMEFDLPVDIKDIKPENITLDRINGF